MVVALIGGLVAEAGDVGVNGEFGLGEEREERLSGVERGGVGFSGEGLVFPVGEAFEHGGVFGVGGGGGGGGG